MLRLPKLLSDVAATFHQFPLDWWNVAFSLLVLIALFILSQR